MPYFILFIILFSVYPFVFSQFLPIPPIKVLGIIYFFILFVILVCKRNLIVFPKLFNYAYFTQIFCWSAYFVFHNDSSYLTRIVLMLVVYMALLYAYNSCNGLLLFLKLFNKLIIVMAIGGTLCFFLVLFEVVTPVFDFSNVDGRTAYCFGLTCTNTYVGNLIRYGGYFDEPGAMANWGMFALLFNKLFIKNQKYENALVICLFFTLSLAYYIQLFFYFFLFAKNRKKRLIQLICGVTLIVFGLSQTKGTQYEDIYRLTVQRFEFDDSKNKIAGDNRSNLSALAKEQFLSAPILGVGAKKLDEIGYMADNPYEILAKDGIVGEIVTYLPLLLILYVGLQKRPDYICAVFILFLGYLQRPFHVDFIHPIMLYLLTILILEKNKLKSYDLSQNISCNSFL